MGCGEDGGVTPALLAAGYDVLAIDPHAPAGASYRQTTLEELDDPGPFAAAVAGRVLHHVDPLGPALDKLAALAPLIVLDEFSSDRIDDAAEEWWAGRYREHPSPHAPSDLAEWRGAHRGLHPYAVLRRELDLRYEVVDFHWRAYLHRWLRDPETQASEERLIEEGVLQPIGYRYTGRGR